MDLYLKNLRDNTDKTIVVAPSDTIHDFKIKCGIKDLLLEFNNTILQDQYTISHYNINTRSYICAKSKDSIYAQIIRLVGAPFQVEVFINDTPKSIISKLNPIIGKDRTIADLIYKTKKIPETSTLKDIGFQSKDTIFIIVH